MWLVVTDNFTTCVVLSCLRICSVGLGCDPPGAFLDILGLDSLEVQSSPGVGQVKTIEELCLFLRYRILLGAEFVAQGVACGSAPGKGEKRDCEKFPHWAKLGASLGWMWLGKASLGRLTVGTICRLSPAWP